MPRTPKILCRVVKSGWEAHKLGSWILASPELYERGGPRGTGHLRAPSAPHAGVPSPAGLPESIGPRGTKTVTAEAEALAGEHDVALGFVPGSGKGGRILVGDVREAIDRRSSILNYVPDPAIVPGDPSAGAGRIGAEG